MHRLAPFLTATALALTGTPVSAQTPTDTPPAGWTREQKAGALNLAAGAAIVGWGIASWDYGSTSPHASSEGWFGRDTKEGGADKLGHLYTGYALSHLFGSAYGSFGYDEGTAIAYGTLSSIGVTTLMELGDSFSEDYGFSFEDQAMNLAGAAVGYLLWRNPELDRKLDLRVEYDPFVGGDYEMDIFTDYERLRYLVAIKAEGFDAVENPWLKHLEFQVGYYARGYADHGPDRTDERERNLFVGVGINLGRLLRPYADTRILDYVQVPYTSVEIARPCCD